MWKRLVALIALTTFVSACYKHYQVPKDEFAKIQSAEEASPVVPVKTVDGEVVKVDRGTRVYARSKGGRRYRLTPFNFKLTQSQLVASDRDTILMLDEVKSFEVDKLSVGWTVALIAVGAAAVAGLATAFVVTSGSKSLTSQ